MTLRHLRCSHKTERCINGQNFMLLFIFNFVFTHSLCRVCRRNWVNCRNAQLSNIREDGKKANDYVRVQETRRCVAAAMRARERDSRQGERIRVYWLDIKVFFFITVVSSSCWYSSPLVHNIDCWADRPSITDHNFFNSQHAATVHFLFDKEPTSLISCAGKRHYLWDSSYAVKRVLRQVKADNVN